MILLYCSDVAGAFDRVEQGRLSAKLDTCVLHHRICTLLQSWLEPRESRVVLDGVSSELRVLINSVFQGTVLGPPLWNIFYADSRHAVNDEGFEEVIFADDLNCSKQVPSDTTEEQALSALQNCQQSLHRWGAANQVLFDAGKESFHGLHRTKAFGEDFKILGVLFDCQLTMRSAIHEIATEAGWKVKSILRRRRFYNKAELVKLYKAQVLSFIESRTAAIHHAAPSVLDKLDRVQRRFLREVGLSEVQALQNYKLAPVPARRDIAMIGLLHRASHGQAPGPLTELLLSAYVPIRCAWVSTRSGARHGRQLPEFSDRPSVGHHTETLRRSCFGLVTVWNMLPADVADAQSTKLCQRSVQNALIQRVMQAPDSDWQHFFLRDARALPVHIFQRFFL